jgi:hypothetical protein
MFKNKLQCCTAGSIGKIVLIAWVVFATLYVIVGEYNRMQNYVYNAGISKAVSTIITQSQKCQAVPVTMGDVTVNVVDIACLQKPAAAEDGAKK